MIFKDVTKRYVHRLAGTNIAGHESDLGDGWKLTVAKSDSVVMRGKTIVSMSVTKGLQMRRVNEAEVNEVRQQLYPDPAFQHTAFAGDVFIMSNFPLEIAR